MTAQVRLYGVQAARGEPIDMSELDRAIADFCKDLSRATPETGMALTPAMADMVAALEELAQIVKAQCGKLGMTEH